jgi:UDP-N-acetylglucosamine 1-carboxyvinyltransferase
MAAARPFHWEYQAPVVADETIRIEGGQPLRGDVPISGSKNAALKLLAAATLTGERCRFTNVPEIADVALMVEVLSDLGVVVEHPEPGTYEVSAGDIDWNFVPLEAAARMRASFILLGPLLARIGKVIISNPGGDRIGRRPVDLHVEAMQALGATIEYRNGYYFAQAPGRLRGGEVVFPHVTVMGTENAILAATLADGHTTIRPAAREPEIDDLIKLLQAMGAEVERTAPDVIEVEGRRRLRGATHHTVADRIEAGTFAVAAAVTGGAVTRCGAPTEHRGAFRDVLDPVGVDGSGDGDRITVRGAEPGSGAYTATDIETAAYPGLATDLQPPTGVLLTQASGRSTVHETIYEDRLEWLTDLGQMGVQAQIQDAHHAVIDGPARLQGAEVVVGDLRAGASLILGALAAEGRSTIHGMHHVRRGYETLEEKLLDLGASIDQAPGQ